MFEIELMHLLNEYKNTDDYSKEKIKHSISNLIKENNSDFNKFISNSTLDDDTKKFLNSCVVEIEPNESETSNQQSDFEIIKNKYSSWLDFYNKNNKKPDLNCEKIILEIINFYALNRFEVILQVFKVNDSEDFESFKSMLKNYLRKYFADKILSYYQSVAFEDLYFLAKRKKRNLILKVLDDISLYKFDINEIVSVL